MSKEEAIFMIPNDIKIILKYVDEFYKDNKKNNKTLNFFNDLIDDSDICVLNIMDDSDQIEGFKLNISSQYDNLLYQQLIISICDRYLDDTNFKLTRMYLNKETNLYSFHLLDNQMKGICFKFSSIYDLSKLMEYYNEKISSKYKIRKNNGGVRK